MVEDKVEVARRYLEALRGLDPEGMLTEVSDDMVLEIPFAPAGLPRRLAGKTAVATFVRAALGGFFREFEVTRLDIRAEEASDRVVAEYESRGTTADGRPYANSYVNLIRVRDGKVVESREFYDALAVASALATGAPDEDALR